MAEMISVKADLDEVMALLEDLNQNQDKMRRRVLSGVGTAAKNKAKKSYRSLLNKRTGNLYKSLNSRVIRSGKAVIISPSATKNGVRYGYVLAKGAVIRPKRNRKRSMLSFEAGGKWICVKQVTIPERDWVEGPVKRFLESGEYRQKLDSLVQKEIDRAEKAAQQKAK